jgi:hypothetical protein
MMKTEKIDDLIDDSFDLRNRLQEAIVALEDYTARLQAEVDRVKSEGEGEP